MRNRNAIAGMLLAAALAAVSMGAMADETENTETEQETIAADTAQTGSEPADEIQTDAPAGEDVQTEFQTEAAGNSDEEEAEAAGNSDEEKAEAADLLVTESKEALSDGLPVDSEKFLTDIATSVNDRIATASSWTESDLSMMTNDEIAEVNEICLDSEKWFYERYNGAEFESKNLQYLCDQYITGLQNQMDACSSWETDQDIDAYNELWDAGYAKRSGTVAELYNYYDVSFADISDMLDKAQELDELDEDTPDNSAASAEEIRTVQTCLNTLDFRVGEVDGNCGYRTVQMIRRFQKMYDDLPADGIIDDELLTLLQTEAEAVTPETEAETETE